VKFGNRKRAIGPIAKGACVWIFASADSTTFAESVQLLFFAERLQSGLDFLFLLRQGKRKVKLKKIFPQF
jgi:hypothetical protein